MKTPNDGPSVPDVCVTCMSDPPYSRMSFIFSHQIFTMITLNTVIFDKLCNRIEHFFDYHHFQYFATKDFLEHHNVSVFILSGNISYVSFYFAVRLRRITCFGFFAKDKTIILN